MKVLASTLQMELKSQSSYFLGNSCIVFDRIAAIYGDRLRKQNCICGVFRKITVRALRPQTPNFDFLITGLGGSADLIFILYSQTKNGLPINSRLVLTCNLVKVSSI
jgi:hypothetical protein